MFKCKNCGSELEFYMAVVYDRLTAKEMEDCIEQDDFSKLFENMYGGEEVLMVECSSCYKGRLNDNEYKLLKGIFGEIKQEGGD